MILQMHLVIRIFTPLCLCQSLLYCSALTHQPHAEVDHCRSTASEPQSWVLPKVTASRMAGENYKGELHGSLWHWWIALPGGRVRPKHGDGTHAWSLLSFSGTRFYFPSLSLCSFWGKPTANTPGRGGTGRDSPSATALA